MSVSRPIAALARGAIVLAAVVVSAAPVPAYGVEGASASWRLEQPQPPSGPAGQPGQTPIGLGKVGDIEFWGPNRGLLTTAGDPPTIPPSIWAYNGRQWHELATVCAATDGRIAWAGPEEFWTISDGRVGQAISETGVPPPLLDNTLCHFNKGAVEGSFAAPAFRANSYQPMHAAGCFGPEDCWFAGDPLPAPQVGAFQLHWDGHVLSAEPNPQGHAVKALGAYEGGLYEGVLIRPSFEPRVPEKEDRISEEESPFEPSDLHLIRPAGVSPTFTSLTSPPVPIYAAGQAPWTLEAPRLSADTEGLWGAANPLPRSAFPPRSEAGSGQVTIVHDVAGAWNQVVGPAADPGGNPFTTFIEEAEHPTAQELLQERQNESVGSIAAEPGSEDAWLALGSEANSAKGPLAQATVERLSAAGALSERQALPSAQEEGEGTGPKGAADKLVCPERNDCWLATTQGWLFHLSDEATRVLPEDTAPAFSRLITERPPDAGVPQVQLDAPPEDNSGLLGEPPAQVPVPKPAREVLMVGVPLLSHVRSRVAHGNVLELSFHLAVKTRMRLLAKRRKSVVASTPTRTLAAGSRKLLLRLDVRRWPTKLELQTHPLAPLPTVPATQSNETVTTSLRGFPHARAFGGSEFLR
jgi:hypothetical protein